MKIVNLLYRRRLFFQLLGFVLLLNAALIFSMAFVFTWKYQKEMQTTFMENSEGLLKGVETGMNMMIDDILDVSKQIYNDRAVSRFLREESFDSYESTSGIMEKVVQLKASSRFIDSVYVYSALNGMVYSSVYGLTPVEETPDQEFLKWFDGEGGTIRLIDTHPVYTSRFSSEPSSHCFSIFVKLPFEVKEREEGAIILNIDQRKVYEQVLAGMEALRQAPFYVLDEENHVIMARDIQMLYLDTSQIEELEGAWEGERGSFTTDIGGQPFQAVYSTMPKTGWKVVSYYSLENVRRIFGEMSRMVLLLSVSGLVFSVLVSSIVGQRGTRELDQVLNEVNRRLLKGGGQRKLSRAYAELSRTIESNQEMRQELAKTRFMLKERFLVSLLHGARLEQEEIDQNFAAFELKIPYTGLIVGVLLAENYDERLSEGGIAPELADLNIEHIIRSSGLDNMEMFHTDISEIVLIIDGKLITPAQISACMQKIGGQLEHNLGIRIRVGICDQPEDVHHIRQGYRNAKEALRCSRFWNMDVIYYSDITGDGSHQLHYPFDSQKVIGQAVRMCDRELAGKAVREFLVEAAGQSGGQTEEDPNMILLIQLNSYLINLINDLNLPMEEVYRSEHIMRNLANIRTASEAEFFFCALTDKIISVYEKGRTDKQTRYYYNILDYLKEHYKDSNMTLELLSENVKISASYINQILKEREDKTFTQLLNEMRIQQACRYLEQGGYQIQEIAGLVGYGSAKYFISVFKKVMGSTPGSYKK